MTAREGTLLWPLDRVGEALVALASAASLERRGGAAPRSPSEVSDPDALSAFLEHAADGIGIEAEPVTMTYADARAALAQLGPALLLVTSPAGQGLLAIVAGKRRTASVLRADGETVSMRIEVLVRLVTSSLEATANGEIAAMTDRLRLDGRQRERASRALLLERLGPRALGPAWMLRASPNASPAAAARSRGIPWGLAQLTTARIAEIGALVAGWALLGRGALEGRFDRGWLIAWALVLSITVPLRAYATRLEGDLARELGAIIKRRLLAGSVMLDPDAVRHEGTGGLLGRSIEAESLETLSVKGGFASLLGAIELASGAVLLGFGAGGALSVVTLLAIVGYAAICARRAHAARFAWTGERLDLTAGLVENMVGHRTRSVQCLDPETLDKCIQCALRRARTLLVIAHP